jgi:hypothetical protein
MKTVKNILLSLLCLVLLLACNSNKSELYKQTDYFVESLQTTYNSYGILGGTEHTNSTSDGLYSITPFGRLINVKIQRVAEEGEYEELVEDLKDHYKGDSRVKDVYICKAGTVMIDCRD